MTRNKLLMLGLLAAPLAWPVSASAADLGGNCCADLEERVAELEATTARKGNRKVSLTVYGQVNEAVMFWDNGFEKNTYVVGNDDSRTRFGFKGKAKINNEWSAGYRLEFGVRVNRIDRVNEEDAKAGEADSVDFRQSNWWIQSKSLGRITVGLASVVSSGISTLNLANINAPYADEIGEGFSVFTTGGVNTGLTYRDFSPNVAGSFSSPSTPRGQIVRYDTPTFAGFVLSANWGEDDRWDVALRYAGELGAFRVAAGASYTERTGATATDLSETIPETDCFPNAMGGTGKCTGWIVGASVMHIPSGIFVAGSYQSQKDHNRSIIIPVVDDTDTVWTASAGIEQKWNSLGKTTIYGVYQDATVGGNAIELGHTLWHFGINQRIDAAAMDLYLAYYVVEVDVEVGGAPLAELEDFQAVVAGAKIKF